MKKIYSITDRNRIVENHLWCIDAVMQRNANAIERAGLDPEDVYQQLALRLVQAVNSFDPEKGKLKQHIFAQLNYELLNCRKPDRLYGIAEMPHGFGAGSIIPFEQVRESYLSAAAA